MQGTKDSIFIRAHKQGLNGDWGHYNLTDILENVNIAYQSEHAGPHRAVGNVSGYRCVSDCRSRGREFDPGLVPYFRGD